MRHCYVYIEDAIISYYRQKFPEAPITVKMHLLEDHMVPFLRQWNGVGYGLMGEQGAESVHAEFNSLLCHYTNIPDQVERLRCVLQLLKTLRKSLYICRAVNLG